MYVALHVNVFSSLLAYVPDPRCFFCCGTTKVNRFCLFKRVAQLLTVNLLFVPSSVSLVQCVITNNVMSLFWYLSPSESSFLTAMYRINFYLF